MTSLDVRPAGPALDLTVARLAALTAEVQRLQIALNRTELALDDALGESAPINAPDMERLTTLAISERLRTPRARRAVSAGTATSPGRTGALSWLAHPLRGIALVVAASHRAGVTA